ncbi:hypothetical protein EJ08DRAFT_140902 [Tothia fuscella]|uniref:Hydrophobin n=1 Tax=Tothia fuscella TaxID=1048955 RepID=A0A9P4NW36_9PEZI|nr:hypothetical protein EJ08DRAFT_140902 [Tothia fuscella]
MMLQVTISVFCLLGLAMAAPSALLDLENRSLSERAVIDCSVNGGTPVCCQGTFAGDLPIIKTLALMTRFPLNPNDINCIGAVGPASATCSGVNTCCQQLSQVPISLTQPGTSLLGLFCQKPASC